MLPAIHQPESNSGFTLTELALVLLIVALLVGGLIVPLSAQLDQRNTVETEKTLNEIREALIGFALVNRRLPRPAQSATNGVERGACAAPADCAGYIPWETLGVRQTDAWNKLIRYSVTAAFAGGPSGSDAISLTSTPNQNVRTRESSSAADVSLALGVPVVIFSHGKLNHGTTISGVVLPDSTNLNADEDANNTGPTTYYFRLPSTDTAAPGGEFDDIVTWVPTGVLFNRMVVAGRLP